MTKFFKLINFIFFKLTNEFLIKKYQKQFSTFKQSEQFCNIYNKDNYSNRELNNFRLERFILNFENLHSIPQPSLKFLIESLSYYLIQFKRFPKILDLGGGFGDGFLYLRNIFKNIDIDYSIVEQTQVVELSKNIDFKSKSNHKITFYNSLDLALNKNNYDFLFISGVLQYLEYPYQYLEKINDSNINAIGLTRNSFSKNELYFSQMSYLFHNGTGIVPKNFKNHIVLYPHTTIEEEKLVNSLNNFKISFSNSSIEPGIFKDSYDKDILFTKENL